MALTKDRISDIIKLKTHVSSGDAKNIVETILEIIKSKLEQGEDVKISGFGRWSVRAKKSRPGRNPHTGSSMEITARRVVTFQPSEKLREAVNNADLDERLLVVASDDEEE